MQNVCTAVKQDFQPKTALELDSASKPACIYSIWNFVKKTEDKEAKQAEELSRVSPLLSLRFVQKLLSKAKIQKHQTSYCCNRQFSVCSSTRLLDNGKATNIFHCNHTTCAVCSKKIYKDKNTELRKAFKYVKKHNPSASFNIMTLTISHGKKDQLEDLIRTIADMKRKLMNHKVIKDLHLLFYHSTLEIVYGKSGWHPHYHLMLSKDGELSANDIQAIGNQWQKIGSRLGVAVNIEKGFHVGATDCIDAAATYLSKCQEHKDLGQKLAAELVSDNKSYRNNETYSIQQLISLAAADNWHKVAYSKFKVEQLIIEYLQVKHINYFRGCTKWNAIVKLSADEQIEKDNNEKQIKKYIDISPKAFIELSKHDLLLGKEIKDSQSNIIEYEGILKEHRRNTDIEDTYGYILFVLESNANKLYSGIENDIVKVTVNDEEDLQQDLSFSKKQTVLEFSFDSAEQAIAA